MTQRLLRRNRPVPGAPFRAHLLGAGLALALSAAMVGAQEGAPPLPLGEDGAPIAPELVGMSEGLLTRLLEDSPGVVIDGDVYILPPGTSVRDPNGAVRGTDYLEPGMYIYYRFAEKTAGDTPRRVVSEVRVLHHDPNAINH